MDILFLESNTYILEDLRMKLGDKLEVYSGMKKPLIFFNQLDLYAEKGMDENQKQILTRIIKNNKVVIIYIRQQMKDNEEYDKFYIEDVQKMGVKYLTIIDVKNYLDDDYIIKQILKIYKGIL